MSLTDEKDAEFENVSENNFNRISDTISKVGYSDGITDGRESIFQKGFDCGYENGLCTAFDLAKYKAFFGVMHSKSPTDDLRLETERYEQLNIPQAKDKSHFKMLELPGQNLKEVSNRQVHYVQQQKSIFDTEFPIVTNLFSQ